jgi:AcrR family transcriptional regulator
MLMPVPAQTRQRIAEEALRLFADKGYAGTSVAEIERAAGLKPGAGGLYAHFESKRDVLAAAVGSSVGVANAAYSMHAALPLEDPRAELTVIVRGSLLLFDATGDWIRVRLKEHDQFPELFAGDADLSARAYRYLADWLHAKVDAGVFVDHDCEATADVLFGAISSYWQRESSRGRRGGEVDRDQFVAAWVDLASRLIDPDHSTH